MSDTLRRIAAPFLALLAVGATAAPETPTGAQLLKIVFTGWSDNAAGRVQTVTPARSSNGWGTGEPTRVLLDPKLVLRTGPHTLTLIAGLVPAFADGTRNAAHVTPMGLAAYQFRRSGAGWVVAARQEGFGYMGFFGEATLRAVTLSNRIQGIGVETGSCWQGVCGSWLALYELGEGQVRPGPAARFALAGTNINSSGDCAARLRPLIQAATDNVSDYGTTPATHDCYAIESSWSVAPSAAQPGELAIRYQGAMSRRDAHSAPPRPVDQRQLLRYSGGKYQVVSGDNPVPPI